MTMFETTLTTMATLMDRITALSQQVAMHQNFIIQADQRMYIMGRAIGDKKMAEAEKEAAAEMRASLAQAESPEVQALKTQLAETQAMVNALMTRMQQKPTQSVQPQAPVVQPSNPTPADSSNSSEFDDMCRKVDG